MTIESVAQMTHEEAVRATERIRLALDHVSTAWADLGERITDAYQRRADLALGYGSWAAYAEAELKPSSGLAVAVRRQLVAMLSDAGMSTRAIAPTVGVRSDQTIRRDLAEVRDDHAPAATIATTDGVVIAQQQHIDLTTGEILDDAHAPNIVGLDGKTYTRPTPRKENKPVAPKRRPITDQFFDAAYDVSRRIESLHKLAIDNRMAASKNKVAQKHMSDLIQSRDLLQQVIEQLS